MKPPYSSELDALGETYSHALTADVSSLRTAVHELGGGPAMFVGSGGSMALTVLAARLHEHVCRQPSVACTSLQALDAPQLQQRGAMLFSSSAKHPDAQRVLLDFRRGRFTPAVLVTHRLGEEVQATAGHDTHVVTLPEPVQRDGFLATGSILQTATLLIRAYLEEAVLPAGLVYGGNDGLVRSEVIVLTTPSLACVATDIEVRLVESGLANVQVADYRNFAHGRHTGFARRRVQTTVIALSDATSRPLAEGTTEALPADTDLRRWHYEGPWEGAVVALLGRSMHFAGTAGKEAGIDVGRPAVPIFGRRLYRLPLRRRIAEHLTGGIERKMLAGGCGDDAAQRAFYGQAAEAWIDGITQRRFAGLVLDYDGTVCWTRRRWELPDSVLRGALVDLLEQGAIIGFASGRGQSLHADLRRWIPSERSAQVVLGLYNGAIVLTLDDELPDLREPTAWSRSVVAVLQRVPFVERLKIEERGAQVSVSPDAGSVGRAQLASVVVDHLAGVGISAKVVSSAHAIDIVQPTSTKISVADRVELYAGGEALAVGDQGQLGGNDHALLARTSATLSVDRCSADPRSCWFAGTGEHVGPDLLERYLKELRKLRGGFAFKVQGVS